MRRLTRSIEGLSPDRGATAILVALLLAVLLGAAGLAIDLGASFVKKQQLQNGADAAAMALAQEYALDGCAVAANDAEASVWVQSNINHGTTTADASCPAGGTGSELMVQAKGDQEHWFIKALPGAPGSSEVSASATVEWGSPIAGGTLPLAFSDCIFESTGAQEGSLMEIWVPQETGQEDPDNPCKDREYPPGGFGWLAVGSGAGTAECRSEWIDLGDGSAVVPGDPGNDDVDCKWEDLVPSTVVIPIFEERDSSGPGKNATYTVTKFASFELLGMKIQTGNERYGFEGYTSPKRCDKPPTWGKWKGHCVFGRFVEYVTIDTAFDLGPITNPDTLVVRFKD